MVMNPAGLLILFGIPTIIVLVIVGIFANKIRIFYRETYRRLYETGKIYNTYKPSLPFTTTQVAETDQIVVDPLQKPVEEPSVSSQSPVSSYDAFVAQMGAPNYPEALKAYQAGFKSYWEYQEAIQKGYNTYAELKQAQERCKALENIARKVKRISINDLVSLLGFSDRNTLYQWILSLPDDLIYVDGEYVVFKFASESNINIDEAINRLVSEFETFLQNRHGRI